MATIFDLPNELMDEVGIDLDEDDWLALRMTCQKLNDRCREYHLNSKHTHRRVLLVQESMENLAKISQHSSKVNLRVQYLDISCLSPYSLEPGFYSYNPWQGCRTSLTDEELKMMAAVQKFDREHHKQIEGLSPDPNIMIAPLIQALQNLPNIQEELDLELEYVVRLDDEFKEEVITLPESRMFSSLRKLRLAGFKIDVENLKVFLIHCKQSLKEFTLDQLGFQTTLWDLTTGNWCGSKSSDGEWGTNGEIVIEENDGGRFHFDSDDERYYSG
ncbi:hypothetical protein TWF225_006872 [Orbilia oligospora]|nr:hypothetical protein TWF225_006872 [Orbilia oligospora]